MELIEQIKQDGIAKGLCRLWQGKLKNNLSVKQLVDLYVKGIDFCISEDFPTLAFLRKHFKGRCEDYGVFIDEKMKMPVRNMRNLVFNGECTAMAEYDGYAIGNIYVRGKSLVGVSVMGNAFITIDAFDDTQLAVAVAGSSAKVNVHLYGNAKIIYEGTGVKITNTHKLTY